MDVCRLYVWASNADTVEAVTSIDDADNAGVVDCVVDGRRA